MRINMDHVPNGKAGIWTIDEFEADEFWYRISLMKNGRGVPPGKYKRLSRGQTVVMSNTPDEIRDFLPFVTRAHGRVLINGLGLGVVLTAILAKYEIKEVIVVEASADVISLVAPSFTDPRLIIVNADSYTYKPEGHFNYVWHDIWDYITADNLPYMEKLHRKYARKTSWQDSWCKSQCQKMRRQLSY